MKKLASILSGTLFLCVCTAAQNSAPEISREINPEPGPVIEMVFVEGGTFTMGCVPEQGDDCVADEKPAHRVTLGDFYIGKYEVTQGQWREIMGTDVRRQRDNIHERLPLYGVGDNYPMYYVNWYETQEFIRKLNEKTGGNYRLPTEAEWEYAARGGNKSRGYRYSGSDIIGEVAWYFENSGDNGGNMNGMTHQVGRKKENELGIHDMTGNVWEWVSGFYGIYSSEPQTNPEGDTGWLRVLRGGSWFYHPWPERVSIRGSSAAENLGGHIGFRLVRDQETRKK